MQYAKHYVQKAVLEDLVLHTEKIVQEFLIDLLQ